MKKHRNFSFLFNSILVVSIVSSHAVNRSSDLPESDDSQIKLIEAGEVENITEVDEGQKVEDIDKNGGRKAKQFWPMLHR